MKENQERVKSLSNKIITLPINLDTSFIRKKYTGKGLNSEIVDLNVRNLNASQDSGDEILSFYIPKGDRLSFASDHLHQLVLNKMLNIDTKSKEKKNCIRAKSDNKILTSRDVKNEFYQIHKSNYQQSKHEEYKLNENSFSHLFENTRRKISYEEVSSGTNQNKAVKYSECNMTDTFNDSLNYLKSTMNKEGRIPTYEKKKCQKITHIRNLSENINIKLDERKIYFKEDSSTLPDLESRERNNISHDIENSGRKNKFCKVDTFDENGHDYFLSENKEESQKRTRSNVPFERIKERLEDGYVEFLKKHRFSSVLTGNKKYEGKTGDYYLMLKNLDTKSDVSINNNPLPEFANRKNPNEFPHHMNDHNKSSNTNDRDFKDSLDNTNNDFITDRENFSSAKSTNKKNITNLNKTLNPKTKLIENHLNPKLTTIGKEPKQKIVSKMPNKLSHNEYQTHANISNQTKNNATRKEIKTNNYNTTKQKSTNHKKSSLPSFIFEIDQTKPLKAIEKIVNQSKNSIDLTPIPTKNNKKKLQVIENEYTKAERAAVLIRRIEYSFGLKNKKDEMIKEANNFYLDLLVEAKAVIIQRWWRKMKKNLEILNMQANAIQKVVRGYFSRKFYSIALRHFKYVYPFIYKLNKIILRNFFVFGFEILYGKFAILAQKKFILQLIKLIQRHYRIHLNLIKMKREIISRSIYVIGKNILSKYFRKIKFYDWKQNKFTKLQAYFRGRRFRNDEENMIKLGREIHPYLFYFMKYKNDKSVLNFKKEKFYSKFCKKFLLVKMKKKIPKFIQIITSLSTKVIRKRNFSFLIKKMFNFRFFRLRINIISKYLKNLNPILNRTFKRKGFKKWKMEYFQERNKCRLGVKLFSVLFKVFIWKRFLNKLQIQFKNRFNVKKLINASYIINKSLLRKNFRKLKTKISIFRKREEILKKFILNKYSRIRKHVMEKFKKNMYFSLYFPRSYKIDKALQIIKNLFSGRLLSDYKYGNDKVFRNLKNIFIEQRKKTKLKKIFNISKVYYLHKEKIHFNKFFGISEKLREIEFERMDKLESIMNRINVKKILMKKIRFQKFALKCFRKKIHESKNEIATSIILDKKRILFNQGRIILSNMLIKILKQGIDRIKISINNKDKVKTFLKRICLFAKTKENYRKLFFINRFSNYSLGRKNFIINRNIHLKNLIRRKILQSLERNKNILSKFYFKWKIISQKFIQRKNLDFYFSNNMTNIFKFRNKTFVNMINKFLISRIFTTLISKMKHHSKLNLLLKSINYDAHIEKSCRCKHLNYTQACEKIFLFRFNTERKIKRIFFDKYKVATGLLYINTYSRGTQLIFKRKVTKNDKRKNILKFLIKQIQNSESPDKRKKSLFAKWRIINANSHLNSEASIIQKYMRLKFLHKEK